MINCQYFSWFFKNLFQFSENPLLKYCHFFVNHFHLNLHIYFPNNLIVKFLIKNCLLSIYCKLCFISTNFFELSNCLIPIHTHRAYLVCNKFNQYLDSFFYKNSSQQYQWKTATLRHPLIAQFWSHFTSKHGFRNIDGDNSIEKKKLTPCLN